jgi:hypothetical protein
VVVILSEGKDDASGRFLKPGAKNPQLRVLKHREHGEHRESTQRSFVVHRPE